MDIKLDPKSKKPIYMQLADRIKSHIQSGALGQGASLPSERVLAKMLGIHRNTVVKAYNELKAEEYVESRQGVGYTVTIGSTNTSVVTGRPKKVNWLHEIKDEFINREKAFDNLFQRYSDEKKYSLSSGVSMPGIYDKNDIAGDIANIISDEGKKQYFYSPYKGDENLRQQIVSFLRTKGISASKGEIQVVTEANQAIDFVTNLLISPGDSVIISEPVSPDTYKTLELLDAKIFTVPVNEGGIDIRALSNIIESIRPKALFVDSSFQDPTGTCISHESRQKLVRLSNRYRVPIIEIDAASELFYEGGQVTPVKAFDIMDNVIYIYSFSLTFVPGLSLAFVVANKEVIKSLSYLVSVRFVATDWVTQKLMAKYLEDGTYYRNIETFRLNYRRKRDIVCEILDELKDHGISYNKPKGGVYIWCRLPETADSREFVKKAYANGLVLIPGDIFYPFKNGGRDYVRINYSYEREDKIREGMRIFKKTLLAHEF